VNTLSDDYERFIADLIANVRDTNRNITDLGYGRYNTIEGICGQSHQIDVSFVDNDFVNPTLILIECKRFNDDPIELEHVKVLKASLDDILANPKTPNDANAIIVTTVGARKGAQRFANFYGIQIELVAHGPNYTFRYENFVQAGVMVRLNASDSATVVVHRKCQSCELKFEVQVNEKVCPKCSTTAEFPPKFGQPLKL
jgi:hypothetical protein